MTVPVKALAADLDYHPGTRIARIDGTTLVDADGRTHGPFGRIVLTVPAPQAAELAPGLGVTASMRPQWAGMFAAEPDLPYLAAEIEEDAVAAWLMRTPGRADCRTLLAGYGWSAANVDRDPADVAADLSAAFARVTGTDAACTAHRWRYARCAVPQGVPFLRDGAIYACGDWLLGDRASHAHRSASALAARLSAS